MKKRFAKSIGINNFALSKLMRKRPVDKEALEISLFFTIQDFFLKGDELR
jgi:hypothetical protein